MPFVTEMRSGLKEVIAGPEIQQTTCILPISAETQDGQAAPSVRRETGMWDMEAKTSGL